MAQKPASEEPGRWVDFPDGSARWIVDPKPASVADAIRAAIPCLHEWEIECEGQSCHAEALAALSGLSAILARAEALEALFSVVMSRTNPFYGVNDGEIADALRRVREAK